MQIMDREVASRVLKELQGPSNEEITRRRQILKDETDPPSSSEEEN